MSKQAAIIGGGITGLSLAYFFLKKGIRATVFEKEGHLGGAASTFKIENAQLERFYHHFFAQDSASIGLLDELGILDKLYWVYPRMGFFHQTKIYPFTTPLDLLAFKPLSFVERVKFGWFGLQAKKRVDWYPLENMTAEKWLTKKIGQPLYEKVWEPMLRAKFGKQASQIPASWVWSRLRARAKSRGRLGTREKLGYLRGSYKVLMDALAEKIVKLGGEIKLNSGTGIFPLPGFDFTIITTPNAYRIPQIEYLGNICLVLKLRESLSKFYWTNIADPKIPFCAMIEQTNAFEDPGYNGYKILYLSNYVDQADPIWNLTDQELSAKYLKGLQRLKSGFSEDEVAEYFVFREKYAQPLPTLGHSQKIPPFQVG
ncbi:MAG: NAD(P)/FAD-dependent oxidoreductase, partial [Candidatus Margulisiibacteriota bacterium]